MARSKKAVSTPRCEWVVDDDGNYQTSCDHTHTITNGTPSENDMRYCCYCGARIKEPTR